jgi:hypothetical protein
LSFPFRFSDQNLVTFPCVPLTSSMPSLLICSF